MVGEKYEVDGVTYVAVRSDGECEKCAGYKKNLCKKLPPCAGMQQGVTWHVIWEVEV